MLILNSKTHCCIDLYKNYLSAVSVRVSQSDEGHEHVHAILNHFVFALC